MSTLMEQLKTERVGRGINAEQAATRAGISRAALVRWESGDQQPTLALLEDYMASLGLCLKVDQLVDDTESGEQIPYEELVIGPGEKLCRPCGQIRSVREFFVDRSRWDGLVHCCKHCWKDRAERRLLKAVAA